MRKMIGKETENKEIGNTIETLVAHNSGITNPDLRAIVPQIGSGTESWNRLGDRVKPKSLVVRGTISTNYEASSNKVLLVRVIIAAQKDVKSGSGVGVATDPQRLLRTGLTAGNNQVPFLGNRNELLYPVNDLKFRVYMDKVFALAPDSTGTGEQPSSYRRFVYRFKQLPASLTFDEGNGDWANNFAPFICTGYAYADGTSPDIINTSVLTDYHSILSYEDA